MSEATLSPQVEAEMLKGLEGPAKRHVGSSHGLLDLLKIDPAKYPGQHGAVVHGEQLDLEFIKNTAQLVIPQFAEMTDTMDESQPEAIEETGKILESGGNVVLATSHDGLIDPAMALGAVYTRLKERGYDFSTGISVSKMLSRIGYKIGDEKFPTIGVLQWICDDIYLSIPRTKTTKDSSIGKKMPQVIGAQNRKAVSAMKTRLKEGGLLLAMSPSGTTDKPKGGKQILGRLTRGTTRLMAAANTYVLPIAVELSGKEPFFEICDNPKQLKDPADAHGVMRIIAERLNQRVKGKTFEYNSPDEESAE